MKALRILVTIFLSFSVLANLLNIFTDPIKTVIASLFGVFLILVINGKIKPPSFSKKK